MPSPYRISSNTRERRQKTSNGDFKRPQMTSNDINWSQKNPQMKLLWTLRTKLSKNKIFLKLGDSQAENVWIFKKSHSGSELEKKWLFNLSKWN